MRHKAERIKNLGNQEKKLREKLRETAQVIEDAETEADALRTRIHDVNDEMEKVKSEQRLLVLQGSGGGAGAVAGPVDLAGAVEAMRIDFDSMFSDPLLPATAKEKGAEVEAGFVTMANLVVTLSALTAEYKAARSSAPPVAPAAKAPPPEPPKPQQEAAAAETNAAVKEAGGEQAVGKDAAEPDASDVVFVPSQTGEARGAADASRDSKRDRTPPPGKAAQKIAKMSDQELLGPRKARD